MTDYAVLGIDFGTRNCRACVIHDNMDNIIYDDHGNRFMPSCIFYNGNEIVVGAGAVSQSKTSLSNTIFHPKHYLDHRPCLNDQNEKVKVNTNDECIEFTVDGEEGEHKVKIEEAISELFKSIFQYASQSTHYDIIKTAITVSDDLPESVYKYILKAAEIANLPNPCIVKDSIATLLSHNMDEKTNSGKVVLLDLGASTPFLSLYTVKRGLFHLEHNKRGDSPVGDLIDNLLYPYILNEACRKVGRGLGSNVKGINKLKQAISLCKEKLSTTNAADIVIDGLYDGMDFHFNLNRGRMDTITRDVCNKLTTFITSSLASMSVSPADITTVIVSGASALIPMIQSTITTVFPRECVQFSSNPDEDNATGAAKYANQMEMNKNITNSDVYYNKKDIYIYLPDSLKVAIPTGIPLPTHVTLDQTIDKDIDIYPIQILIPKVDSTYIHIKEGTIVEVTIGANVFEGIKVKIVTMNKEEKVLYKEDHSIPIDTQHMKQN
ncbi:hypothetical protein WA158_002802 [Blastocystis sp. Blastoise]